MARTGEGTVKRRRVRRGAPGASSKLADVAKMAGVSTATASRVINAPDKVSAETREKVLAAVRSLNWIPHGAAKALASLRTRTVGALIPTLGHQTIASMLEAIQQDLGDAGYTLLLGKPDPQPERTLRQAAKMLEHGIECLILMGEDQPPPLMSFLASRSALHVIAYTSGRYGTPNCIGFDNFLEMSRMTEHLLGLGHRDFAIVSRGWEGNDRIRQRVEAVKAVLRGAGLAVRPQHEVMVEKYLIGAGRQGMQQILNSPGVRPTAVVCVNDYLAAGAVIEAKAAGLSVPGDISVTGFDDLELAAQFDPPLTTVRVPAADIGHAIARFVIARLEGEDAPLPARFVAELMIRGSTGPAPAR
jgi:LacI family transcriptional regulator